jgi:hypothetical protein
MGLRASARLRVAAAGARVDRPRVCSVCPATPGGPRPYQAKIIAKFQRRIAGCSVNPVGVSGSADDRQLRRSRPFARGMPQCTIARRRCGMTGVNRGPKRRNKISGQFTGHLVEMRESPAWWVLNLAERRLLDRLELEHSHHGGVENGRLIVTYGDFVKARISRKRSSRR